MGVRMSKPWHEEAALDELDSLRTERDAALKRVDALTGLVRELVDALEYEDRYPEAVYRAMALLRVS